MIIQLKDRCKGYSELFREHFNHLHNYTIDTEKIVYISDKSYSDSRENCTIHFINGEILKIYSHEYDEVVNMIYGDKNPSAYKFKKIQESESIETCEHEWVCHTVGDDGAIYKCKKCGKGKVESLSEYLRKNY